MAEVSLPVDASVGFGASFLLLLTEFLRPNRRLLIIVGVSMLLLFSASCRHWRRLIVVIVVGDV